MIDFHYSVNGFWYTDSCGLFVWSPNVRCNSIYGCIFGALKGSIPDSLICMYDSGTSLSIFYVMVDQVMLSVINLTWFASSFGLLLCVYVCLKSTPSYLYGQLVIVRTIHAF